MLMSIWLHVMLCGIFWACCCSCQQALPPMPAPIVVSDATGLANALATGRIANVQINGERFCCNQHDLGLLGELSVTLQALK